MNPSTARGLVIGCTAGASILASTNDLASGKAPDVRIAVGAVFTAAILYSVADFAPKAVGMFSVLILTGALLTNGVQAANIITTATKKN